MAVHGKDTYFSLNGQNISQYLDSIDFPEEIDTPESTGFTLSARTYVVGLKTASFSATGRWDATCDGFITAAQGAIVAFIYGPNGNTSGRKRRTGNLIIQSYGINGSIDDVVGFNLDMQVTGAVTGDTF